MALPTGEQGKARPRARHDRRRVFDPVALEEITGRMNVEATQHP